MAAATATEGENVGSEKRRRRRQREVSPESTRLMLGWIRFRELSRAEPSRGKRTKVETLEWRLKALFPCFRLSLYFLFPDSTPFWVLTV